MVEEHFGIVQYLREAAKNGLFLSGQALTPPPLNGRATKKDRFLRLPLENMSVMVSTFDRYCNLRS